MTTEDQNGSLAIGFIMGVTYRKIASLLQKELKAYDITPEQWSVLHQIDRSEGMIQREIAARTGKDKPTTTRILDHLENKGLVYKQTGQQDRRSFLVYSTERGKALIRDTLRIEEGVTEEVKACLSAEEYVMLTELLLRINDHVSQVIENKDK
ncbi:MarR family winged helix-turn-helix transcriptional regulator [Fontibacillus sp. BL9]|uniref:MarR family winged helix-turn-helix transcriptional regulator n=1 Tax=Fontibacillus sp. BL9 TaxID=3389971 RepID=UPI003977F944